MRETHQRIIKNSIYLYILTFSNYFLGLLLYPYLSRILSVDNFGLFSFSMSFSSVFQVIVEYGFMISVTAMVAKNRNDKDSISRIITNTLCAKFLLLFVAVIIFSFVATVVPMVHRHAFFVSLFFVNGLLIAMVPDFYFRGIEEMKTVTIKAILTRVVSYIPILLFVKSDSDIILIPISLIVGNLLTIILTYIMLAKDDIRIRKFDYWEAVKYIKDGFFFFLSRFAVSINSSLGSFTLGIAFSPTSLQVGYFAGCAKLSSACEMMLSPIADSIYPHMVNKKDYKMFARVLLCGMILWSIVILIAMFSAEWICAFLLGAEYAAAGQYLRILLIGTFFAFPSQMLGYPALSPIGQAKHANFAILISTSVAAICSIILVITSSVTLHGVCFTVILVNIIHVIYRGFILIKSKALIQ